VQFADVQAVPGGQRDELKLVSDSGRVPSGQQPATQRCWLVLQIRSSGQSVSAVHALVQRPASQIVPVGHSGLLAQLRQVSAVASHTCPTGQAV